MSAAPETARREPATELGRLLNRTQSAGYIGVNIATWQRWYLAGALPEPVRLPGRRYWRREELDRWIAAGCPNQRKWRSMQAAQGAQT